MHVLSRVCTSTAVLRRPVQPRVRKATAMPRAPKRNRRKIRTNLRADVRKHGQQRQADLSDPVRVRHATQAEIAALLHTR